MGLLCLLPQEKVTILEERSDWDDDERDWDDDERSGGEILVIQERLAQNQQDFLDEYLPQWDENLAIQKKESESEWENPFAAKRGENHNHTILHLSKEENDDDDLPYPKFRNFKQMAAKIIKKHEENAFPSSSSQIESTQSYQPPMIKHRRRRSILFSISVMVQDTPIEETVFMAIEVDESDDDLEEEDNQFGHHAFMFHPGPPTKIAEMVQSVGSWKPDKELPVKSKECEHEWNENTVTNYTICYFCGILTTDTSRLNCPKCQLTTCALCARNYLGKTVNVKRKQPQKQEEEKDFNSNEVKLLKELLKEKTEQVQQMIRDQAKEYYENKAAMQKKEEIWQSKESLLVRDLTDALKIIDQLRIEKESLEELRLEKEKLEEQKDEEIRELKAQLQKKKEEEEVQFSKEEFPPLGNIHVAKPCVETEIHYFGNATASPKGYFLIEESKFKIPLIYAFDMRDSNGIEMLIGANFLRSMKGGIRIEGDEITIYKKVTKIKTSNQTEVAGIAELEVDEEEFLEINESIYFNQEGSRAFQEQFKPVIDRLKQQGYIGEEPLKHWKKNGELCKLDIINPDVTIEDKPLNHVTPVMEDIFRKHVDSLLKIGAIRPSKSRHRTMAMIVNSGTTVDPVTGREVKGKERMVFNYKSLNDNTYKDQYSLPGINTIIKRIGGAKIFSKFDLKSGFHQVAMDEESIPWTAFLVPGGLYEWLVMPFGLKNAPAVFQRKMDKCFKGTESFIAICEDNGLVLSPTKMKIAVSKVDFLGAVIGEGTIKLQPHIIKKIVNFNEEELKTKKGLRMGGVIKLKKSKKIQEVQSKRIMSYASANSSTPQSTIDAEIHACINTFGKLKIYYLNKQEVTLRTDCQAIISFYNKTNSNKSSRVRWIKFADAVTGTGVKINIEHIEGKHNTLADSLSRLVNLCFAGCTGEMKELAAAALYSVEKALQSPYTSQKNMKTTCEEVMKISNHFLESSSQKLLHN
ncbi:Orf y [Tanacetum coccineum]